MANIGQSLTTAESGYKRYDNTDINLTYNGNWANYNDPNCYNSTSVYAISLTSEVRFNFTGAKLRLIGSYNASSYRNASNDLYIDNNKIALFSQIGSSLVFQTLDIDINNLGNGEHFVRIVPQGCNTSNSNYYLDAIDIDENGILKPYNEKLKRTMFKTIDNKLYGMK
jgi:hypothetical protein